MNIFTPFISEHLHIRAEQVDATLDLLDAGCTIPFISRYRKEATGNLNEVQVAAISDLNDKLKEMQKRKDTILKTIEEQGKLTDELRDRITASWNTTELEDLYLPFKPKRRTRAQVARERGLEPLANTLMMQFERHPEDAARRFVKGEVKDTAEAIKGAQDIIAERISEDEGSRQAVRGIFRREATIASRVVPKMRDEDEAQKYSDYFFFSEELRRCSSHRLLAMRRGEAEGVLRVTISADEEECTDKLKRHYVHGTGPCQTIVGEAIDDAFKRLLGPQMETEFSALSKEKADDEAIKVFRENLRQLLLAAPLGQKRVMGVDPGIRTGCKVVMLDAQGNLLYHDVVFATGHIADSHGGSEAALRRFTDIAHRYGAEAIAVGNGTASRETADILRQIPDIPVYVVSEDGASIYSASATAREEFPNEDVTVRGAVSIGRRLMDPLAELVKIDPKSIGVGQYQHDVDQTKLKHSLDQTVELCVNSVAHLRQWTRSGFGSEHRRLPQGARCLHLSRTTEESAAPRPGCLSAVCGLPAHSRSEEPARCQCRASRELSHRGADGQGLRLPCHRLDEGSRGAQEDRSQPLQDDHRGTAHAARHHEGVGEARP